MQSILHQEGCQSDNLRRAIRQTVDILPIPTFLFAFIDAIFRKNDRE